MSKQLGLLEDALATFLRLDKALPDSPDILYQARPPREAHRCTLAYCRSLCSGKAEGQGHMAPLHLQVAGVLELKGDAPGCTAWLQRASALVPTDAGILMRLGALHAAQVRRAAEPLLAEDTTG